MPTTYFCPRCGKELHPDSPLPNPYLICNEQHIWLITVPTSRGKLQLREY